MDSLTVTAARAAREATRNPWLGVELRHLAALAAVAREGSFRGAADTLGYVQSAVSQQLAQLERTVGQRLVERQRGATLVELTPAGELMLRHAETILAGVGAAHADLAELGERGAGRLRVGACHSLAAGILPCVLPALLRRAPKLRVEVSEAPAAQLASQVAEGSLDAAFAELPLPSGPFVSTILCEDSYLLLSHPGAVKTGAGRVPSAADLSTLALLGHPLMENVEPLLHAAGVAPRYELWCASLPSLRTLVAAGAGSAIVPALLGSGADDGLVSVPLDAVIPNRTICVFRHAGRAGSRARDLLVDVAVWACGTRRPGTHPRVIECEQPNAGPSVAKARAPLRAAG
jgi:DNA-binding transcriptional LysR family regulator